MILLMILRLANLPVNYTRQLNKPRKLLRLRKYRTKLKFWRLH